MKIYRIAAAAVCAATFLSAAACSSTESGEVSSSSSEAAQTVSKRGEDITLKSYKFPEFLSEISAADVLSNPVYTSFNSADIVKEPKKQPFDGYKCTAQVGEDFYIFKDGENYGLLSADGEILINSTGVKKISAVASNLLQVRYDDGTTEYFHTDLGGIYSETVEDFDETRVGFSRCEDETDEDSVHYVLQLDGEDLTDMRWTSFERTSTEEIDTAKKYEAVYRAVSAGVHYYIAFDKFYNLTVYEAEYGFISMKIGGEYGECYILDGDDYADLQTLISSFGSESRTDAPSKDESEDYIQITTGLADGNRCVRTISPEGFCFTEDPPEDDGTENKFFTVMNPQTFLDLVSWTDSSLSREYGD